MMWRQTLSERKMNEPLCQPAQIRRFASTAAV
jgi:hypothetical protein